MAQSDLKLFARPEGWGTLAWKSLKAEREGLFSQKGTLLIGLEDDGGCVLAWLNQHQRWHLVRGLIYDGRNAEPGTALLVVHTDFPGFDRKIWITLTIDRKNRKALTGRVAYILKKGSEKFSEEDVGTFTAKANPIGDGYSEPRQEKRTAV